MPSIGPRRVAIRTGRLRAIPMSFVGHVPPSADASTPSGTQATLPNEGRGQLLAERSSGLHTPLGPRGCPIGTAGSQLVIGGGALDAQ